MNDCYVAVDVETTGLTAGVDEIIEIGAVKVKHGELCERFQSLVKPVRALPKKITELTGITEEMLRQERSIHEVLPEFLSFVQELPLIGHNLVFDYSFFKAACQKEKLPFEREGIDTLRLARILHPALEKKTLTKMAEYYGVDTGRAHRACDDAVSCAKIYVNMREKFEKEIQKKELFLPQPLKANIKKIEPATSKQKKYLLDLLKCHRIEEVSVELLTKSEASKMIDFLKSGQLQSVQTMLEALPVIALKATPS